MPPPTNMTDEIGQPSSSLWHYEEGLNPAQKLRSTCDRCMMLKVRCDKQKPRCERCESVQVRCVYSPYRWKKKMSSHHQHSSMKFVEGTQGSSSSTIRSRNQEDPRDDAVHSTGIFSLEAPNLASIDLGDLDSWYVQCMDVDHGEIGPVHAPTERTTILETLGASDTSMSEGSNLSGDAPMCSCQCLALTTLQDMLRAKPQCHGDAINSGLGSGDHIVKINRTTMHNLERLLSCAKEPCTRDPTVLFLTMALFSKALAWYHSAFVAITREIPPPRSTTEPPDLIFHDQQELTFTAPIQVGDFPLDFFSAQRMRAQFLLCEVQKLTLVFDRTRARHLCHTQADSSSEAGSKDQPLPTPAIQQFFCTALEDLTDLIKDYCIANPSN
ncbi:aflatoxin biosynthesis regulatory protein [Talaromyces pinophilus]|uniref:Aflatoxin biosynthesis regulatory protein n=1 Tax=Talaromyces pinophilus TaxID=128442 RepID=A0A0B8N466_TALPI|nr:aflatoxin biosynthesis regulatory protein [Talaromyces pinophilus]